MPFSIEQPADRARLDPRDKPYFQRVGRGLHVGYRKGKLRSSWVIRWQVGASYRSRTLRGVVPDDPRVEKGARVMNFHAVVEILMTEGIYYCSFCRKSSQEVEKLVAGPDVYICNECVKLCQYYMDHPDQKGSIRLDANGRAVLDDKGDPVFDPP